MPRRADILFAQTAGGNQWNSAGTQYVVQTPAGVLYLVYINSGQDVHFRKSTDGGLTWSNPTSVHAGTDTQLSVWYDRWSGINAGLIHVTYQNSVTQLTYYRTIDTESSDALSTQTTVFTGVSANTGGHVSITRARGGNVYCRTVIDGGVEGGFFKLLNANVPNGAWEAALTEPEAKATQDQMILVPGFAADTQDIIGLFWDASANEISRYVYDDSGNSWAETSIATTMLDQLATTAFPHFAAAVDLTNSKILLVAWSAVDAANADLRCWVIDEGSITETTTPVVSNGTDDQGMCGIGIDLQTGWWWVVYSGKSDGSETYGAAIHLYCKCSKDGGTTWGPESQLTAVLREIPWLVTIPRRYRGPFIAAFHSNLALPELGVNVEISVPTARLSLGI